MVMVMYALSLYLRSVHGALPRHTADGHTQAATTCGYADKRYANHVVSCPGWGSGAMAGWAMRDGRVGSQPTVIALPAIIYQQTLVPQRLLHWVAGSEHMDRRLSSPRSLRLAQSQSALLHSGRGHVATRPAPTDRRH